METLAMVGWLSAAAIGLRGASPCPSLEQIDKALRVGNDGALSWVEVRPSPDAVKLALWSPGGELLEVRELPRDGSCEDLALASAAVITEWSEGPPHRRPRSASDVRNHHPALPEPPESLEPPELTSVLALLDEGPDERAFEVGVSIGVQGSGLTAAPRASIDVSYLATEGIGLLIEGRAYGPIGWQQADVFVAGLGIGPAVRQPFGPLLVEPSVTVGLAARYWKPRDVLAVVPGTALDCGARVMWHRTGLSPYLKLSAALIITTEQPPLPQLNFALEVGATWGRLSARPRE